ncbi:hypothetical protein AB0K74_46635, partial [Streptomyces sp. NPDC056159]
MLFRFHPRSNAAVLAAPLLLFIVVLYVSSDYVSGDLDGYWTAATAKAASALIFIAPAVIRAGRKALILGQVVLVTGVARQLAGRFVR